MEFTTASEVEEWFGELDRLASSASCEAPRFIKPFHLATLTHRLRLEKLAGINLPSKITSYANTMQLWEVLGIEPPQAIQNRSAAGRYFPLEFLRDEREIESTADALVELLKPVCSDARTIDAIHTMLRELIGNCYAHTAVEDGVFGVICAQVWSGGRKAQIAIADTGIGIRTSLEQNEDLLARTSVSNCCELSTEYGVTSKPGKGHSGYGLAVARGLIEQNNGTLIVRSGKEGFCWRTGKIQSKNTDLAWHGTLLVIEWSLDTAMNIREVYDSFPLPEGMDHDDFDF